MKIGIAAVDAAKSSGWAVLLWDTETDAITRIGHGQCSIDSLRGHMICYSDPVCHVADEWVLAVEKPFIGPRQSPRSAITHSESCGDARCAVRSLWPKHREIWRPTPSQWRRLIPGMPQSPTELCKKQALQVARAMGAVCKGPRGGDLDDEAEAICIGLATIEYWRQRRAKDEPKKARGSG